MARDDLFFGNVWIDALERGEEPLPHSGGVQNGLCGRKGLAEYDDESRLWIKPVFLLVPVDRVGVCDEFHGVISGGKVTLSGIPKCLVAGPNPEIRTSNPDADNRFELFARDSQNFSLSNVIREG